MRRRAFVLKAIPGTHFKYLRKSVDEEGGMETEITKRVGVRDGKFVTRITVSGKVR